ncbi:hypothetical protein MMC07_000551 [Pseudocyphellaria aurata]|nr:hypothetical protein [Pseudocyphellaria aurata]
MPLTFIDLPPEIIDCVLINITSVSTLCNLARCSQKLHRCTIPHLYRHIELEEEISSRILYHSHIEFLASRPDLAGLVRSLTLHVVNPSSTRPKHIDELKQSERSFNLRDLEEPEAGTVDQALESGVNAQRVSEQKEKQMREQSPHKAHQDVVLASLLPSLTKMERLVLYLDTRYNTGHLEHLIRRAFSRESPFDIQEPFKALSVFVNPHEMKKTLSTDFLALLLKLPAMQQICGNFGDTRDDDRLPDWGRNLAMLHPSSSPLTTLDLTGRELSAANLAHILRAPKALEKFTYRVRPFFGGNFQGLYHALEPQEHCLQSLTLDYDSHYDSADLERSGPRRWRLLLCCCFPPRISFTSFISLKLFKTVAFFLEKTNRWGDRRSLLNIFPSSLEAFHLTRCKPTYRRLFQAMEDLLVQKSSREIPSLRRIILEEGTGVPGDGQATLMSSLRQDTPETAIGRLSRVAAAQDVSLAVQ